VSDELFPKKAAQVIFTKSHILSDYFSVTSVENIDFETLILRLSVEGDYSNIEGFQINWRFLAKVDIIQRTSRFVLSIFIGYTLFVFLISLRFTADSFTQILLIMVGISGVLACNPFANLWPPVSPKFTNHVLLAIFLAVYRLFLLFELELLATRKTTPSPIIGISIMLVMGLYAVIEMNALYDREIWVKTVRSVSSIVLDSEGITISGHIWYSIISMVYITIAIVKSDRTVTRRVVFFVCSILGSGVVTLIIKVLFVLRFHEFMFSIVSSIVYMGVHVTFGAIGLFMMYSMGNIEYEDLDGKMPEKGNTELEIEQLSDDENKEEEGFSRNSTIGP
jgi:hypothetical protein